MKILLLKTGLQTKKRNGYHCCPSKPSYIPDPNFFAGAVFTTNPIAGNSFAVIQRKHYEILKNYSLKVIWHDMKLMSSYKSIVNTNFCSVIFRFHEFAR